MTRHQLFKVPDSSTGPTRSHHSYLQDFLATPNPIRLLIIKYMLAQVILAAAMDIKWRIIVKNALMKQRTKG